MHISKIIIRNFRLLQDSTLDVKNGLSILIGKNNTGKTSLITVFQKFFLEGNSFNLDDYPLSQRKNILNISQVTPEKDIAIQMILQIKYNEKDDLAGC